MKIGIDIDDVLIDFCGPFREYHNENYGTNWADEDITSYDLEGMTGDTWQEMQAKMDKFVDEMDFFSHDISPDIAKSLQKLSKNHELYIITSRPNHYKERTLAWIKQNLAGLTKELLFVYGEVEKVDKWEYCVKHGIELMIEDMPEFAIKCNEAGIRVMLFNHTWNQNVEGKNVTRVKSWIEIEQILDENIRLGEEKKTP